MKYFGSFPRHSLSNLSGVTGLLMTILAATVAGQGPGRGPDAQFAHDRDVFHYLLEHHQQITRQVTLLEQGVETVTESNDAAVVEKLQEHVRAMYTRVDEGRPIRMRDPLFRAVFRHAGEIKMQVEPTEKGVRVIETAENPVVVRLIQAHAAVVSKFVEHGFAEAHRNHEVPPENDALPGP